MPSAIETAALFLFVPADRPERFAKAFAAAPCPVLLRVNPVGRGEHAADMRLAAWLDPAAVMLPKAESASDVRAAAAASGRLVVALVESAAGLAGRSAPIDGVTAATRDEALVEDDAAHAAEFGFSAKLLIHPAQIAPAARGFAPSADEIAWAGRAVEAGRAGGAVSLDGEMVDAPVTLRAQAILAAAGGRA